MGPQVFRNVANGLVVGANVKRKQKRDAGEGTGVRNPGSARRGTQRESYIQKRNLGTLMGGRTDEIRGHRIDRWLT